MKVKSEGEVAQSCLTLSDTMDCSLPGGEGKLYMQIFGDKVVQKEGLAGEKELQWGYAGLCLMCRKATRRPRQLEQSERGKKNHIHPSIQGLVLCLKHIRNQHISKYFDDKVKKRQYFMKTKCTKFSPAIFFNTKIFFYACPDFDFAIETDVTSVNSDFRSIQMLYWSMSQTHPNLFALFL